LAARLPRLTKCVGDADALRLGRACTVLLNCYGRENASMKPNRKRFMDETGTRAAAARADRLKRCHALKVETGTEARTSLLAQNLKSAA